MKEDSLTSDHACCASVDFLIDLSMRIALMAEGWARDQSKHLGMQFSILQAHPIYVNKLYTQSSVPTLNNTLIS